MGERPLMGLAWRRERRLIRIPEADWVIEAGSVVGPLARIMGYSTATMSSRHLADAAVDARRSFCDGCRNQEAGMSAGSHDHQRCRNASSAFEAVLLIYFAVDGCFGRA